MRISSITINTYKSIVEPFTLDEPGKMHIFIGSNNAGKTNILDAIQQLYSADSTRLTDANTDLKVIFQIEGGKNELSIVQHNGKKDCLFDGKPMSEQEARKILDQHIIRLSATHPIELAKLQKDYEDLIVKHGDLFRIFHDSMAKYIPQIQLNHDFLKCGTVKEDGVSRPFERLGAGFQQTFVILMYMFHPDYTILLLEEPEIHLHPALISRLLQILERQNLSDQIFMTTHSPLFIHPENLHQLFRIVREGDSTRVYSPRLSGHHLDYNRLTQELNAENCEMFFADTVLLVEGPSDHILMRGLINRFYSGHKDIKVIQVYGKSNIDVYGELLDIFNIPHAVMLDQDALYDTGIKMIRAVTGESITEPEQFYIDKLKERHIFILANGSIERNYPRRYQRRQKHKTQNAIYAANRISQEEYNSPVMKYIKEVIDSL
jgi:predicted ATP-dependent endonuclease of OLD family